LLTNFICACNNHRNSENKEAIDSTETNRHQPEIISEKLALNNSAKWKADSTTNNSVKNLLAIIEVFSSGADKSLTGYKKAADDLQQGLDKMISECKMQGPDHDALHKWLEPLIGQVATLKQASTEVGADKLFEAIHAHVNLYTQYFE
jgi:hypothetical protein